MFQLREVTPDALDFGDLDGRTFRLDLATLLDLSHEARDALSGQRRPDVSLRAGDAIRAAERNDAGWVIALESGQQLTLTDDRLIAFRNPHLWRVTPRPWSAADAEALPVYDHDAFMRDPETLRQALRQLAAWGFVRLTGGPTAAGALEPVVAAFGCLRETNYGRIFDVRTKLNAANLADTALALAPHTDNPYRLTPPDVQILHCLVTAGEGGQSLLVDGLAVSRALLVEAPADHALLSQVPVRFAWADDTTRLEAEAPIIALKPDGSLDRIRYNPRSAQKAIARDDSEHIAWRTAQAHFHHLLTESTACLTFDLKPGDMVLMDNRRVLHGRTGFAPSGDVIRHLQGAYADMDGVYSTLRRLTELRVADNLAAPETMSEAEGAVARQKSLLIRQALDGR